MAFRAVVISKSGPQPGNFVRNPAILEDWFFRRINMPLDEAVFLSQNSLKLSSEDFLRVSSLKDRVRLMKGVRHQEAFRRRDELVKWYALLDQAIHESPTA